MLSELLEAIRTNRGVLAWEGRFFLSAVTGLLGTIIGSGVPFGLVK